MRSLTQWLWSWVGPCHHHLSRPQGLQVGMLINNVIVVCLCVLGEGRKAWGIDQHLFAYCETLHYICTRVIVHACCITGQSIQSFSLLLFYPVRPPLLFFQQAYRDQPLILARSSIQQKETSAQWENALIIHDHLTIQDLVCVAYVAFLISVSQPHSVMAVSLWLSCCILHLQIITKQ